MLATLLVGTDPGSLTLHQEVAWGLGRDEIADLADRTDLAPRIEADTLQLFQLWKHR